MTLHPFASRFINQVCAECPRGSDWSAERDQSDRQVRRGVDFSAADVDFNVDVISVGAAC